jgi:hypothetical protein
MEAEIVFYTFRLDFTRREFLLLFVFCSLAMNSSSSVTKVSTNTEKKENQKANSGPVCLGYGWLAVQGKLLL